MRVLVVEDEAKVAGAVRRGLEAEGIAVDVATDGTEGLWLAGENPYDVIVLDIMLPGMSGFRVCEQLRQGENWTPILMLTAKHGEYDVAEALDSGADDYLTKPFSFVVLLARSAHSCAAADGPRRSPTPPATCDSTPRRTAAFAATSRSPSPRASSRRSSS